MATAAIFSLASTAITLDALAWAENRLEPEKKLESNNHHGFFYPQKIYTYKIRTQRTRSKKKNKQKKQKDHYGKQRNIEWGH